MKRVLKGLINVVLCAFFLILKPTHCTDIVTVLDYRLADYCADQRAMCEHTGSYIHIVCEYYGKTGSSCSGFREFPLDESIVNEILYRINSMRIQVAKGKAMGMGQSQLPQAYGMKKVFWDSELAAFAQIMLHQCLAKHRYTCAATKNFSNTLMAYTFANTTISATAIIDNIFSSWNAAAPITRDNIFRSPDLKGRESQFYIKMVMGKVSHVGCAIGVYEHEIRVQTIEVFDQIQLSGHIICYMSHYSRTGTPIYNTTAPVKGTGWTRCGCPPKFRENKDCLCVPSPGTELTTKQQSTTSTTKNMSLPTTSTHAYYDNYEKYMSVMRDLYDGTEKPQEVSKTQVLDLKTEPKPESKPPNLSTPLNLSPPLNHRTGVTTPVPTCNDKGNCEPKIVMLPIFTIQNAPQNYGDKRGPAYNRRSVKGNTSSVQTAKPIDDFGYFDEKIYELPRNISVRSKLLQTVRKIRNKEGVNLFSNEQNEPEHQMMDHNQLIVEPFERILRSAHLTGETSTKQSYEDHDRNEKAKKRVNNLLDLLEEKGKTAKLTSREIIQFHAKMRRIYKTVLGTREKLRY